MLGDDIMVDEFILTKQLIDNYDLIRASTSAIIPVSHEETLEYFIIDPTIPMGDGLYGVR